MLQPNPQPWVERIRRCALRAVVVLELLQSKPTNRAPREGLLGRGTSRKLVSFAGWSLDSERISCYIASVLSDSFDRLFSRLVMTFKRHQDVPRTPESVAVLALARTDLDVARSAIAQERDAILRNRSAPKALRRTSVSDDDIARLRVLAGGSTGS